MKIERLGGHRAWVHRQWSTYSAYMKADHRVERAWASPKAQERALRRKWILGAADPEMGAIAALLHECGEDVLLATRGGRRRVRPGETADGAVRAYGEDRPLSAEEWARLGASIFAGEAKIDPTSALADHAGRHGVVVIDHHAPGDPGYGRPPAEFLAASSIGQVISHLARLGRLEGLKWEWSDYPGCGIPWRLDFWGGQWWCEIAPLWDVAVPQELVLVAAADHCLAAAYRGECPGVDPDALMAWRVASRAAFQGRSVEAVLADIEATREALRTAPWLDISAGIRVRDMRRETPYPELPEAAAREDASYVSGPLVGPDGQRKMTCAGSAEAVAAFLRGDGIAAGLVERYGDPARGFAGGYER